MNVPSNITSSPPLHTQKKEFTRKCFGEIEWARQFGSVREVPPLPDDIEEILDDPCPFFKAKKVFETHILALIPASIDQEPLTLDKLGKLIGKPKRGNPTKCNYDTFTKEAIGSTLPDKTHWVLMTKDVIPGSRNKMYWKQIKLVAKYKNYQLPQVREAVICIAMEYIFSKRWIYGQDPLTYTRCQETVGFYSVAVGGFNSNGIFGSGGNNVASQYNYFSEFCGVGALREL